MIQIYSFVVIFQQTIDILLGCEHFRVKDQKKNFKKNLTLSAIDSAVNSGKMAGMKSNRPVMSIRVASFII